MKKIMLIVAVFSVFVLASCTAKKDKKQDIGKAQAVFAVHVYNAQEGNLDDYLNFGGDVTPVSSVDIYADTSGKLSNINVVVGDTVRKDQILAGVDASRPGMTYSISPVKAPVSGTITSLPVSVGSTVAPSMSIGKISSTNELEITTSVAERYVSRIKLGQTAFLSFDAYPSEVFIAKVTKINPVLDTTSRSMAVTLKLVENNSKIKIGMYARIKLITENKQNVIVVPYTAAVSRAGETFMFVLNGDDTVRKQTITTGIRVDDMLEVISGLKAGDQVVVKGQTLLENGSKINVVSGKNE